MTGGAARVDAVLKAYDIRGATPDSFGPDVAAAYAVAFAEHVDAAGAGTILLGRDVRTSSDEIGEAVRVALTRSGRDVVDIGVCSTDMIYFGSGTYDLPGIMITASHNPARDNGMKFCRAGARPVGRDNGLSEIAVRARELVDSPGTAARVPGSSESRDLLGEYAGRLSELVPVTGRRLTVVVDAANAVAGQTAPAVFAGLSIELIPLYFEPDGTFPHHEPNPLAADNLADLRQAVREHGADIGLAFDGDADRCFVVDASGAPISGSAITSLIAERTLATHPGATILYNVICSRAVRESVERLGGVGIRTPVGHSLIKARMAETGARFGGEHSGHFYFADFFLADSGMLAALHVLAALAESDHTLAELVAPYERYSASGELNSVVDDAVAVLDDLERRYAGRTDVEVDRLDGVDVSHPQWRFNVRPSNTEPVLRLNVEADDQELMERIRDELLAQIRE